MLSGSEASLFSSRMRREILRLSPQDDIVTQSRRAGIKEGDVNWNPDLVLEARCSVCGRLSRGAHGRCGLCAGFRHRFERA
jgi:hypothetical protein